MIEADTEDKNAKLFQEQFLTAMAHMIACSTWRDLWIEFLFAYLYRSQFSWLEESGSTGKDGLASALCVALATYLPNLENDEGAKPSGLLDRADLGQWQDRLRAALTITIQEKSSLERFRGRLLRHVANPLTLDVLQMHIAHALHHYTSHQRRGVLPDPF